MNTLTQPSTKKATISLYPNPTTDSFQISGIEETALLIISDLNCYVLLKKQITCDENIKISHLRNGVYIAKIVTPTGMVEKKLVKK
jgi:hypothetical protein